MDSTPPATNRSPSPARTAWQAATTADRPEAQSAVDGNPGHRLGEPGEQGGHAGHVAVVLAGLVSGPEVDVLDLVAGYSAPGHGLLYDQGGEVVRPFPGQRPPIAADRGAHGRHDDGRGAPPAGHARTSWRIQAKKVSLWRLMASQAT
jgi:hypothetical protein